MAGRRLREKSFFEQSRSTLFPALPSCFLLTRAKDLTSVASNGSEAASSISTYSPRLDSHTVTRITSPHYTDQPLFFIPPPSHFLPHTIYTPCTTCASKCSSRAARPCQKRQRPSKPWALLPVQSKIHQTPRGLARESLAATPRTMRLTSVTRQLSSGLCITWPDSHHSVTDCRSQCQLL